jgi:glycine/D-amino acid oxidase-like deaminating enzyme
VDPVAMPRALLRAARGLGARIVSGATVNAVRDGMVSSSAGEFPASTVVVAAGTGTTALCPSVPVPASPAFRLRVRAPRGLVRTIVATDQFDVREAGPGLLLATAPLGADRSPAGLRALAGRTTDALRDAFGGGSQLTGGGLNLTGGGLRLIDWAVGERPMPPGGPVIGWVAPGTYVAVMHSAICLAPVAGRLIAEEIVTGVPSPLLAGCRPAA